MKRTFIISAIIFLLPFGDAWITFAQNVGINTTGAPPHASALLDIDAAPGNNQGLLIPRVALTAINSALPITAPAISLLVYNTAIAGTSPNNVVPGYYYWNGTKWVSFGGSDWSLTGNAGTAWNAPNFLGTTDNVSLRIRTNNLPRMIVDSLGNVGIGTASPVPSAKVEIISTTQGTLITRMTTVQRNAIASPAQSLLIYNITTKCFEFWENAMWQTFGCACIISAQPSVITGTTPVCRGDIGVAYSVINVAGVTYTWSYSGAGYTQASGGTTDTITANFSASATSGILTCTPSTACGIGTARTFAITVKLPPTTANAGSAINPACGVTIATLAGNTPSVGTGEWSVVSGTATITTPSSPTSGVTGLDVPGTATLRWTVSNDPCVPSTSDVVITTVSCCSSTITTYSWSLATAVFDPVGCGGSITDFDQGTVSFATKSNVTNFSLTTAGYAHSHNAGSKTITIELFNPLTSTWIIVWSTNTSGTFNMGGINVTFPVITQVSQMRINVSCVPCAGESCVYHGFSSSNSFTLDGC